MEKIVKVGEKVLKASDRVAGEIRETFRGSGTLVLNLISSPGSGKTTLLEETVKRVRDTLKTGVLVGDIATEKDADRLRVLEIPTHQILTGGACHLDARQILESMDRVTREPLDILFIENVGNLVCPTSYDLGEDRKVVLLSVTEGDDKPFKYPGIFARAGATVITKTDLLPHVTFDLEAVSNQVRTLNPDAVIIRTSSATGDGLKDWIGWLKAGLKEKRSEASV